MPKTRQIMKFCEYGKEYSVVRVFGEEYPYRIYHYYRTLDATNRVHEHKELVAKADNLYECFRWFIKNNIV